MCNRLNLNLRKIKLQLLGCLEGNLVLHYNNNWSRVLFRQHRIVLKMAGTCSGPIRCCSMCSYCASGETQLLNHVLKIHRHDPNFHVYCSSCLRSYHTLSSFRKHISRGCVQVQQENDRSANGEDELEMELEHWHSEGSEVRLNFQQETPQQWHAARFILSIKEKHVLSQAATDTILFSTTELLSSLLDETLASLRQNLPEEWMQLVQQQLSERRTLFSGLSTPYLQQKYFKEEFHLVVRNLYIQALALPNVCWVIE